MYEMFKESDPLPKFDENEIDGKKMYDVYDIE